MSDREIIRASRRIALEMGIGKEARRLFLLGRPHFSLSSLSREDIRRALQYVDETINHKEHALVPSFLMISG